MEIIHQGFDGLDVSFEVNIGEQLSKALSEKKELAITERDDALLEFNGLKMHVAPDGGAGGYAFRASTGPLGAIWFFKKPNPKDRWGVRCSVRAAALAVHGLGGARAQINATLEALGLTVLPTQISLGRADYAIDFLAPGFVLEPDNVTIDAPAGRADFVDLGERRDHGLSGRYTSTTIGKSPGWQVIIYDERREVLQTKKAHWPVIWNTHRAANNGPPIKLTGPCPSEIWRIEVRAGKAALKRWKIRRWAEFDDRIGDALGAAFEVVRYRLPDPSSGESNRSRWPMHPIWLAAQAALKGDLGEMISGAAASDIRVVYCEEQVRILSKQIEGLCVSLAALNGCTEEDEMPFHTAQILKLALDEMARNQTPVEDRLEKAAARYVFL